MDELIFIVSLGIAIGVSQSLHWFEWGFKRKESDGEKYNLNFKPFSCALCMGFWVGLFTMYYFDYQLITAFTIALISEITYRKLKFIQ